MKYVLKRPAKVEFKIDYTKTLNSSQLEVVQKAEGPSLVLAGAGSGKTRTLVYRVLYLLEKGIPPANILFVTFTNKAAFEMKSRIERQLGHTPKGLWCGTFHHVGHRCLRLYAKQCGLSESFVILDEEDSRELIKHAMEVLPFKPQEMNFPKPNVLRSIISYSKNVCRPLREVVESRYPYFSHFIDDFAKVQRAYESAKVKNHALDYDDLILRLIRLLEDNPEIREKLSSQFVYCLVDEYQDTNRLQNRLIEILAEKHRNLLVVGDDAQSIYSFRGAEVKNILDFPKRFPKTAIYKLETNYRSTPQVLDMANNSILHNRYQFTKKLKSLRDDGSKPQLVKLRDPHEQSAFVAQRVLELNEEGVGLNEIAVLFRARYQAAELELELAKRRIPYVLRGGVRFFEQAHIKDVLAYLKLVHNLNDRISWLRALRHHRGIGIASANSILEAFFKHKANLKTMLTTRFAQDLPRRAQGGFGSFCGVLKSLLSESQERPAAMIERVLAGGLTSYVQSRFDNAQDRIDDLKELVNFANTYTSLGDFLDDISLRESFKGESFNGQPEESTERLVLSTIHQAKGLEWKTVIIINVAEGQFPHYLAQESDELEEERRLFYVASTRAKDELIMIHPMTRYQYDSGTVINRPSVFLEELSRDVYEESEIVREDEEEAISFE